MNFFAFLALHAETAIGLFVALPSLAFNLCQAMLLPSFLLLTRYRSSEGQFSSPVLLCCLCKLMGELCDSDVVGIRNNFCFEVCFIIVVIIIIVTIVRGFKGVSGIDVKPETCDRASDNSYQNNVWNSKSCGFKTIFWNCEPGCEPTILYLRDHRTNH